ncbi:BNR/Asp-box repeat protein [Roseimaritima multifibrata]|uniref:BNR/Asp-box repeat protein n=1 Tax=Roseimaritima multifibrata TaxID=1930274 RepID=A0A517MJ14_9BACT|nr:sialidase family protein [Roseimaritima multifibrata]QDS94873.1 BNR/Asp-box repeat protein [Roseimaritima multifibrata]
MSAHKFCLALYTTSFAFLFFAWNPSSVTGNEGEANVAPATISIPTFDISDETERHSVVAQGTTEIYQGHPCTVLLPDGKTMFCTWSINHAGYLGPLSRSDDGGKTWSGLLDVPANWTQVRQTTPTIHYLVDPEGVGRIFVFGGRDFEGRLRQAYSEDGGVTWTPMKDTGLTAECAPKTIMSFDEGKRLVMWCDRRGPFALNRPDADPYIWQAESLDGGLTWSPERPVVRTQSRWGQPAVIKSPDEKQLLMVLRNETFHSLFSVSDDGGKNWSKVRPLPAALTGHRPKMLYAPDGRLVMVMRDTAKSSKTHGHFIAWVGTYEDVVTNREGEYRIKLFHSNAASDCGYSGFDLLPDGTFVATTYVKYRPGPEKHSVMTTRFKLEEIDQKVPME